MNKLSKYTLSKYEQETIISFNEDEKIASVYTYNKAMIKKLDNVCLKFPDLFQVDKEDLYGKHLSKTYKIPKKYISVRMPKSLSDEQKIASAEKAKNMRKAKMLKE